MIEVKAVSCSRNGTYDAEVQLKWGDFDSPSYKQVHISKGWPSHESAKEQAEIVARSIYNSTVSHAISQMAKYRDAQP